MNIMKTKKAVAIFLCLILALSMAACGDKESDSGDEKTYSIDEKAYPLYTEATENFKSAESFEADMNMEINMKYGEETSETVMGGIVKQINLGDDDYQMFMDFTTASGGEEASIKGYYKDKTYYMTDSAGAKYKTAMTAGALTKTTGAEMVEFDEDSIKGASVKENDEGVELSFVLDGEKLTKNTTGMLGTMNQSAAMGGSYKLSDMNLNMILDADGNVVEYDADFVMSVEAEDIENSAECKVTMNIEKYGNVKIDWPKDLKSYKEYTGDTENPS